jgi:hypothetical protein
MPQRDYNFNSENEQYLEAFDAVLGDVGALHLRVVNWVQDQGVFEDDAAVHAAAFSIKTEVMRIMQNPQLRIRTNGDGLPEENTVEIPEDPSAVLAEFAELRGGLADPIGIFVSAVAAQSAGDMSVADVREAMNQLRTLNGFSREQFEGTENYTALADAIMFQYAGDPDPALNALEVAISGEGSYEV